MSATASSASASWSWPSRSPAARSPAPTSASAAAVLTKEGAIAIEVELTPKAPRRLYHLIRAWRFAVAEGTVKEVYYLCAPGQTRAAVERAVAKVRAEQCITIGKAVSR